MNPFTTGNLSLAPGSHRRQSPPLLLAFATAACLLAGPGCEHDAAPVAAAPPPAVLPTAPAAVGGAPAGMDPGPAKPEAVLIDDDEAAEPGQDVPPVDTSNGLPFGDATFTGTVWAPGNAPGMVPDQQEIPISGALVQVTPAPVIDAMEGVHCALCVPPDGRHTLSDAKGSFELPRLPAGDYWLSIRKGQFAVQHPVTIVDGESRMLDVSMTTLPSVHAPELGAWLPRIAVALGTFDDLQDILGKMGIGGVDASGSWDPEGPGAERVDAFSNEITLGIDLGALGIDVPEQELEPLEELVTDLERMKQYHLIFLPCSNVADDVLQDPAVLENLRQYVELGGKLYVTDWSGSWHDNVFPQQVRYTDPEDTPPEAYDPVTSTWNIDLLAKTERDTHYDSEAAEAVDPDLFAWLDGQVGPLDAEGNVGPISAGSFNAIGGYNIIEELVDTVVGLDDEGMEVIDHPRVFVQGATDLGETKLPLTVTYQPAGCGRVLYSTYHTTDFKHEGLLPQERILLYLIMEITVCREEPVPILPPKLR